MTSVHGQQPTGPVVPPPGDLEVEQLGQQPVGGSAPAGVTDRLSQAEPLGGVHDLALNSSAPVLSPAGHFDAALAEMKFAANPMFNTTLITALSNSIIEVFRAQREVKALEGKMAAAGMENTYAKAKEIAEKILEKAKMERDQLIIQACVAAASLGVGVGAAAGGARNAMMISTAIDSIADKAIQASFKMALASIDAEIELLRAAKENMSKIFDANMKQFGDAGSIIDSLMQSLRGWQDMLKSAFERS